MSAIKLFLSGLVINLLFMGLLMVGLGVGIKMGMITAFLPILISNFFINGPAAQADIELRELILSAGGKPRDDYDADLLTARKIVNNSVSYPIREYAIYQGLIIVRSGYVAAWILCVMVLTMSNLGK